MRDELIGEINRDEIILPVDKAIKYHTWIFEMTNRVLNAMTRCGLGYDYQFSTKNHGDVAVIHCPEYYWEGNLQEMSIAVEDVRTAEEFWEAIVLVCKKASYPWG